MYCITTTYCVTIQEWESGEYLSERVARLVARQRSNMRPGEAAIVWVERDGKRCFVDRYCRGDVGTPRRCERNL